MGAEVRRETAKTKLQSRANTCAGSRFLETGGAAPREEKQSAGKLWDVEVLVCMAGDGAGALEGC